MLQHPIKRAEMFCDAYALRVPILMAPMAGACPTNLAIAVADGGGIGACGALLMSPDAIADWATELRSKTNGAFQMNLWIPDPAPDRDAAQEAELRRFLSKFGPEVVEDAAEAQPQDFEAQCEALLAAGPTVISSIMGLFDPEFVSRMKERQINWFATATTVAEARAAVAAGADVIIAQGMEAGGHRGAFDAGNAATDLVGLFSLLPAIVDAVDVPVVATGGIADARGVAAALTLGASAVQIGTGLLRTTEAGIPSAWADAIGTSKPEDTVATRSFSGRLGRAVKSRYIEAAHAADAPDPAPYPIQRNLTAAMRGQASKENKIDTMQAWAGQSAGLAKEGSAADLVANLWDEARIMLAPL